MTSQLFNENTTSSSNLQSCNFKKNFASKAMTDIYCKKHGLRNASRATKRLNIWDLRKLGHIKKMSVLSPLSRNKNFSIEVKNFAEVVIKVP